MGLDAEKENFFTKPFEELLALARQGSELAMNAILEQCRTYLLLIANQELPSDIQGKIAPSDVVQETLFLAWREYGDFRGADEEKFRGWLRRILLNKIVDQTRKYSQTGKRTVDREVDLKFFYAQEPLPQLVQNVETPSARAVLEEQLQHLQKALDQLPETYRQLILWRNYERLSFKEIAERLNCSADSARKSWAKAVELLQIPE